MKISALNLIYVIVLRSFSFRSHTEQPFYGFSSGIIVPGGFGKRGMEGKIAAVKWCRTTRKPFLGVCLGMQAAVIEFTR